MDLDKVQSLLRLVNESGVAEVEVEEDGFKIIVRRQSPTVTLQQAGQAMGGFAPPQPFPVQTGYPPMPPPYAPPSAPPSAPTPSPAAAPAAPSTPTPSTSSEAPATPEADAEPGAGENEILVRAPIVGTFYRAPSPEADPFVKVGQSVSEGDTLCIIEAMKLMNEVACEHTGTVKQVLVEDAEPVEYDQPLFVLTSDEW